MNGGGVGAKSVEQKFALIAGLVYVGVGVIGFFVTGFGGITDPGTHALLGIFPINPFHNIVHIGIGALWLLAGLKLTQAGTEGVNLSIGLVYLLATVLGFLGLLTLLNIGPHADPDNFLHLASGLVPLLFAGPLRAMRGEKITD